MERADDFYNELRQTNKDLQAFLEECNLKSPYFDFTPTFEDYMNQIRELEKKFPPKTSSKTNANNNNSDLTFSAPSLANSAPAFKNPLGTTGSLFSSASGTGAPSSMPIFGATQSTITAPTTTTTNTLPPPTNTGSLFSFGSTSTATTTSSAMPFGSSNQSLFSFGSSTATSTAPQFNFSFKMPEKEPASLGAVTSTSTSDGQDKGDEEDANDDSSPPEPKIDRYEEQDVKHSARCKLYEKGTRTQDNDIPINLLGVGYIYVKDMDQPKKHQVIFRVEPDLRRVLLNEIVTPVIPIKILPKAVQMVFPPSEGSNKSRFIIAKLKDDNEAKNLYDILTLPDK